MPLPAPIAVITVFTPAVVLSSLPPLAPSFVAQFLFIRKAG